MALPIKLSGSTSGRGILVTASTSPGTAIHTAIATANGIDEIFLWAGRVGAGSGSLLLTIEWGDLIGTVEDGWSGEIFTQGGLQAVAPGLRLQGGLAVTAFAATGSLINIFGSVNRYYLGA